MDNSNWIDDITWNDLDMDMVFKRINVCCTSVGEEYLYHILHSQCFDKDKLVSREKLMSYLKSNDTQRLNLQIILSGLGKKEYNGVSNLFNYKVLKQLKYPFLYNIIALLPVLSLIIIFFSQIIGVVMLVTSFAVNTIIYYIAKKKIEFDMDALQYFSSMIWCSKKICNIKDDQLKSLNADLESNFEVFKPLIHRMLLPSKANYSDIEIITEYMKILFLSDVRKYNKMIDNICKNMVCFQKLFECIGELDASIIILPYREGLPFFCVPKLHSENIIKFDKIYHPLISESVANDAFTKDSCIITGSNASGKSTFKKAIAINGICAQTINTCSAYSYSTRFSLVMTSMAVRDNISEGDSYFITAIKSLKRILDKIDEIPCLCFIDEILKWTNTIERIAASAAVMRYLHGKNCLCMVASHDIK